MERPVTFQNKYGKRLFGIVHIPQRASPGRERVGVNLLNPGIKYRVAPHRLNVKLARRLCTEGYYVMRFDPEGIGDSEGELREGTVTADLWGKIQTGLFASDTAVANEFFMREYGVSDLVLIGNCGGAITALLAGAQVPAVRALCLIDIPVYLWSASKSFADTAVEGGKTVERLYSEYTKKLFRPKSWFRAITFRTNYGALFSIIRAKLKKRLYKQNSGQPFPSQIEQLCNEERLNRLLFDSFEKAVDSEKTILFVLAANDPGFETFQKYFASIYLGEVMKDRALHKRIEVHCIENANHVYTLYEWQEALMDKVSSWLARSEHIVTPNRQDEAMSSEDE